MRQSLTTRAIPSPKLLMKDHKTINKKGEFPTRLVIPATNFMVTFSKIGYLGIKRVLDKGKVNYSRFSLVQASNLEENIGEVVYHFIKFLDGFAHMILKVLHIILFGLLIAYVCPLILHPTHFLFLFLSQRDLTWN